MVAPTFPLLGNEFEDESQPLSMDTDAAPTKKTASPPEFGEINHHSGSDKREELHDYVLRDNPPTNFSLEDRVAFLEEKLASLSPLLTQRPVSPLRSSTTTAPYLESPCPVPIQRHLSHVLLREDSPPQERPSQEAAVETCPPTPPLVKDLTQKKKDPIVVEVCSLPPPPTLRTKSRTLSDVSEVTDSTTPKKTVRQKWMDYLENFQESTPDVDNQMEEFVKVPSKLEGLLAFGLFICLDSYLYILTMLPIKFCWGMLLALEGFSPRRLLRHQFHRRHFYIVIQVLNVYLVYRYLLFPISIGQLYHWIRGQALLKLYVLIAIVEVFDRLMCSMGQDCLDSMYWNTTRRPRSRRMLVSTLVVLLYTACHSFILFVHVATLNVAINSADQALLTLLISGNFAEIKSTVFKKYNKANLFKITASDICERFKLALFLTLVLLLNISQGMDWKTTVKMLSMCGIVMVAEIIADWIKHSFITKFNFIPSKVYPQYSLLLAGDVTGIGHEEVNLDHSHAVVKRLGFAQIPLVCVMLRFLTEVVRYYIAGQASDEHSKYQLALKFVFVWAILCCFKIVLGSYLQAVSQAKLEAAPELRRISSSNALKKLKKH